MTNITERDLIVAAAVFHDATAKQVMEMLEMLNAVKAEKK